MKILLMTTILLVAVACGKNNKADKSGGQALAVTNTQTALAPLISSIDKNVELFSPHFSLWLEDNGRFQVSGLFATHGFWQVQNDQIILEDFGTGVLTILAGKQCIRLTHHGRQDDLCPIN